MWHNLPRPLNESHFFVAINQPASLLERRSRLLNVKQHGGSVPKLT
jgi:hypothetical protein